MALSPASQSPSSGTPKEIGLFGPRGFGIYERWVQATSTNKQPSRAASDSDAESVASRVSQTAMHYVRQMQCGPEAVRRIREAAGTDCCDDYCEGPQGQGGAAGSAARSAADNRLFGAAATGSERQQEHLTELYRLLGGTGAQGVGGSTVQLIAESLGSAARRRGRGFSWDVASKLRREEQLDMLQFQKTIQAMLEAVSEDDSLRSVSKEMLLQELVAEVRSGRIEQSRGSRSLPGEAAPQLTSTGRTGEKQIGVWIHSAAEPHSDEPPAAQKQKGFLRSAIDGTGAGLDDPASPMTNEPIVAQSQRSSWRSAVLRSDVKE